MSAASQTQPSAPLRTTLCEIEADPSRFSGQRIELRATIATNFEMSILNDDSCPKSNVFIWFGNGFFDDISSYAFIDSWDALSDLKTIVWQAPPQVAFKQTNEVRRMYQKMGRQQKRRGSAASRATIIGVFQWIPDGKLMALQSKQGKVWATSRFGHQLCCNARLLPEQIDNIQINKGRIR